MPHRPGAGRRRTFPPRRGVAARFSPANRTLPPVGHRRKLTDALLARSECGCCHSTSAASLVRSPCPAQALHPRPRPAASFIVPRPNPVTPRSPRVRRAPTPLVARLVAVPSDHDPAPCLLSSPSGALPPSPQAHRTVHGASARCSPTTSSSKGAPSPPPRRSLATSPPPPALRVPAHSTPTHPV